MIIAALLQCSEDCRKHGERTVLEPSWQENSLQQQEVDHHHSPESFSLHEASKRFTLQRNHYLEEHSLDLYFSGASDSIILS